MELCHQAASRPNVIIKIPLFVYGSLLGNKTWRETQIDPDVYELNVDLIPRSGLVQRRLCGMRHKRRTCARLCHTAGGELEQIQFLLGHISIQTTERYLGCKQRIQDAVNDKIGIGLPD
jgi:hypothetical protein